MAEESNKVFPWTDPKVNNNIVSSTINYYGHGLLKQLADTKRHLLPYAAMKDINYQSFKARAHKLREPDKVKLYTTSVDFILNNADFLFSQPVLKCIRAEDPSNYGFQDKYKNLPPLDYYLQATKKMRAVQFYKDLRRGDLLVCRAMQSQRGSKYQPLRVVFRDAGPHMFCGKNLFLNVNLDISQTRVPKIDEGTVPNTWTTNTLVKVEVLSISCEADHEKADIVVGTMGDTLVENNRSDVSLGKLNRSDVPEIVNAMESYTKESVGSYDTNVKKMESFKNPRCVQHLSKQLNLSLKNTSLMSTLRNDFVAGSRYKQLRRLQLTRWAHKHVADGVAHFKKGEHAEAFQLLNKALSIDTENVEAFVAKGALLANMGSFEKAVEDFESALKFNPEHGNARKYICETLLELGKRHEDDGKLGAAESCFARSLQVNNKHTSSLEAFTKLHARAGFKSSLTLDFLKENEKDDEKEENRAPAQDKTSKPKALHEVEDNEITIISDNSDVEAPYPSEKNGKSRERSLSPLAQKLAMQNNAWKPPSYIDTTDSFLNTTQTQSGVQSSKTRADVRVTASSNSQAKSDAHAVQTKSHVSADRCKIDVHVSTADSGTASSKSSISTLASTTLNQTPSDMADDRFCAGQYDVFHRTNASKMSTASELPTKPEVPAPKQRKESISITPFVVGANKSAAAAAATAAATAPDGKIDQVSSVLVAVGASKKATSSSAQSPSAIQISTTIPMSENVSFTPVTIVSPYVGSADAQLNALLSSTVTSSSIATAPTTTADDGRDRSNSMLDKNFENAMKVKPSNSDEVEVLSLTLIMLSRKFKAIGNKVRSRMCLEKSLKHNPKHEPTKDALKEIDSPSAPTTESRVQQPRDAVVTSIAPVSQQPIYIMPPFHRPPPGFHGFCVPPPNFMGVPPNKLDVNYPPPLMTESYGLPYIPPPSTADLYPSYGQWGASASDPPETSAAPQSQLSQEDKEYHEKVDSFLKHIMNRNKGHLCGSPSRSKSPDSPKSSRRRSPRASSSSKSWSRPERRSYRNGSPRSRREKWNAEQKRGRISRERSISPRDWRGRSRDNLQQSQDRQSPVRDNLQQHDGRPLSVRRPSPTRSRYSWSQERAPFGRRSPSQSPQHDRTASRSRNQVVTPEGRPQKSTSVLSNSSESKPTPRDNIDKSNRMSKTREKKVKKKKHRNQSSSNDDSSSHSSSSSSTSSSGSNRSSRVSDHSKRKKKKKRSKKHKSIPKTASKGIGFADDPDLRNIDQKVIRKIEELCRSNLLLEDAKDVDKKKRKRARDSKKSDTEDEKEKKKKKIVNENPHKSDNDNVVKKKAKSLEKLKHLDDVTSKEKTAKASTVDKDEKKNEPAEGKAMEKTKDKIELLDKEQLQKIAQKYLVKAPKKPTAQLPKEDSKQVPEEEPITSLQQRMQLPGLKDLQKKLKSYYTKCKSKTVEPPDSKDGHISLKLKPSNYVIQKTAVSLLSSPTTTQNTSPIEASAPVKSAVQQDTKPPSPVMPKKELPLSSSVKPSIDAKVSSVFKSALQSVITQSKKESLLPMGPATPELLKRRSSLETVAPPATATVSTIADPSEDTNSRFKSTFQPVSSDASRLPFSKMSLINADGNIITPSEFKAGMMSKAHQKRNEVLEKAQGIAESISKLRKNWRPDTNKKVSGKLSQSGVSGARSRSRSKSRRRRSGSRSRRSRSRSVDSRRRSRSRSLDHRRRSRSRSLDHRRRSRSRSRSRGRSPYFSSFSRVGNARRFQSGSQRRHYRGGGFNDSPQRWRRSRSRSPLRLRRHRSRSHGSKSRSKSLEKIDKGSAGSNKDSMFGKWASGDSNKKQKPENSDKSLKEMQKFLEESKEKKLKELKEKKSQFRKPPDN